MDALEALARSLGRCLRDRRWRLVCAESCTGGWIAKTLTDVPGSSVWFEGGFVTYSNRAKREWLGVSETSLSRYGAVSAQVVSEMVRGCLDRTPGGDLAIAVSGIAGPGGGTPEKPVGTVYFAWLLPGDPAPRIQHRRFFGDRRAVRAQAVRFALDQCLRGIRAHD